MSPGMTINKENKNDRNIKMQKNKALRIRAKNSFVVFVFRFERNHFLRHRAWGEPVTINVTLLRTAPSLRKPVTINVTLFRTIPSLRKPCFDYCRLSWYVLMTRMIKKAHSSIMQIRFFPCSNKLDTDLPEGLKKAWNCPEICCAEEQKGIVPLTP